MVVESYELNDDHSDWHEVVVIYQIDVVYQNVHQVHHYVPERLAVVWGHVLRGQSLPDLLESVLILPDLKF